LVGKQTRDIDFNNDDKDDEEMVGVSGHSELIDLGGGDVKAATSIPKLSGPK